MISAVSVLLKSYAVRSQLFSSITNAAISLVAINGLDTPHFQQWLYVSAFYIYLQSFLRSTILEPLLQEQGDSHYLFLRSIYITSLFPIYLFVLIYLKLVVIDSVLVYLLLAYVISTIQDCNRYRYLQKSAKSIQQSDLLFLIIASLFFGIEFLCSKFTPSSFAVTLLLAASVSNIWIQGANRKTPKFRSDKGGIRFKVGLSNIYVLIMNNMQSTALYSYFAIDESKTLRLVYLIAAPMQVFNNLLWIYRVKEASRALSKIRFEMFENARIHILLNCSYLSVIYVVYFVWFKDSGIFFNVFCMAFGFFLSGVAGPIQGYLRLMGLHNLILQATIVSSTFLTTMVFMLQNVMTVNMFLLAWIGSISLGLLPLRKYLKSG